MKKEKLKQLDVGTLQPDLGAKPYGFCCNIKDIDPRLLIPKEDTGPLFPTTGPLNGGPDIKVRIQEHEDDRPHPHRTGRGGQRGVLRGAQRGGHRIRHRSGQQINWGDQSRGRQRRQRDGVRGALPIGSRQRRAIEPVGEPMKCKRCRGPLQWFLEDEIDVAVHKMMEKRKKKYDTEMKTNIKLSKQKEKRKHKKRKVNRKDTVKDDAIKEEDTQEDESKTAAQ